MYPMKFNPVFKDYLWGGKNLKKYGKAIPNDRVTAESWEISTHPDGVSAVSNGSFKGMTLNEIIKQNPEKVLGTDIYKDFHDKFPLLVKFIDAENNLSVQVHPEDEYAIIHENGDLGKNEMWYVIDAKKDAKLVYGMKENITKESFIKAIRENKIEECLNTIIIKKGDILNIPAGLVHAVGMGIILIEIQQNSNTTYRLYDYNRKDINGNSRPLHIEKALDVITFSLNDKTLRKKGITVSLDANSEKTILIANKYFAIEMYNIIEGISEKTDGSKFFIYVVIEGNGHIEYSNLQEEVNKGDSLLIPASLGSYKISGNLNLLKAYVPDLEQDIFNALNGKGFSNQFIIENIQGLERVSAGLT